MPFLNLNSERIAITSLYTGRQAYIGGHIRMVVGVYDDKGKWTGKSYDGNIPEVALVEWAIEQGYLKAKERKPVW